MCEESQMLSGRMEGEGWRFISTCEVISIQLGRCPHPCQQIAGPNIIFFPSSYPFRGLERELEPVCIILLKHLSQITAIVRKRKIRSHLSIYNSKWQKATTTPMHRETLTGMQMNKTKTELRQQTWKTIRAVPVCTVKEYQFHHYYFSLIGVKSYLR